MDHVKVDLALLEYPEIKKHIDEKFRIICRFDPNVGNRRDVLREVCVDSDCGYLAKINKSDNVYVGSKIFDQHRLYNSIFISQLMSSAGIGPIIYDVSVNNRTSITIMKKYDGTLAELLFLYQNDLEGMEDSMEKAMKFLTQLVHKMHSYGVLHLDLGPGNIFYLTDGTIVIGDYDESIYFGPGSVNYRDDPGMTRLKQLIHIDLNYLDRLQNIYERIRGGEEFYDESFIQYAGYMDMKPPDVFVDHYFDGYEL